MAKCIHVRLTKAALALLEKKARTSKFNYLTLTTTAFGMNSTNMRKGFQSFFEDGDIDVRQAQRKAAGKVFTAIITGNVDEDADTYENRLDVKQKMPDIVEEGQIGVKDSLLLLGRGTTDVNTLLDRSIAMREVLDSIQSEPDIQANSNATEAQIEAANQNGIGTALIRVLPNIGSKILMSRGETLVGTKAANNAQYTKVAQEVINDIIKNTNLLSIDMDATVIMNNVKDLSSRVISPTLATPAIRINEAGFINDFTSIDSSTKLTPELLGKALGQLSHVTDPSHEIAVNREANEETFKADGKSQIKSTEETLKNIQQGSVEVNEGIHTFMKSLHSLYLENDGAKSFITAINDSFGTAGEFDFLESVFGIKDIPVDSYRFSEIGKRSSRVGPLVALMQEYSRSDVNTFFLTYKQANNSRFFQRESALNMQRDSKMSRHILEGKHKFNYKGDAAIDLIGRVGEAYGLPIDVIKGKDTSNEMLEQQLKWLDNNDPQSVLNIFAYSAHPAYRNSMSTLKPWEVYKALKVIKEIRTGLSSKDGVITTGVLLESDAAFSGPFLKLLQNVHLPQVQNILKRLGFIAASPEEIKKLGGHLADYYALAQETFKKLKAESKKEDKSDKDRRDILLVEELMRITGHEGDFRSFIKDPIIRQTYEQGEKANIKETAILLTDAIIKDSNTAILETIELLSIKDIDEKVMAVLNSNSALNASQQEVLKPIITKALSESVTKFLLKQVLNPAYKIEDIVKSEAALSTIFKVTQEIGGIVEDNGVHAKYMPPEPIMEWLDAHPDKEFEDYPYIENTKYRTTLDKRSETLLGAEGEQMLQVLSHANETSAHILPIHAMDAAILIRAIAKVYNELAANNPIFKGLDAEAISIMLVHDATIASPMVLSILDEAYRQEIMNVSRRYSVIDVMLKEARYKMTMRQYMVDKDTNPDAKKPTEVVSMEELKVAYPELKTIIENADEARVLRESILNVGKDGKARKEGEPLKVHDTSYGPDISQESQDIRDATYYKDVKKTNALRAKLKTKKDTRTVLQAPADERGKYIITPFEVHADPKDVQVIIDARTKDKPAVILDVEATGKYPEESTTVGHQIAFKVPGEETITINIPLQDESIMDKSASSFYNKYNIDGDTEYKNAETVARKSIKDKAYNQYKEIATLKDGSTKDTALKAKLVKELTALSDLLKERGMLAHNSAYDIAIIKKVFKEYGIDSTDIETYDTLAMARVTESNELQKKANETNTEVMYVKDVVSQDALMKEYGIEGSDSHTAAGDVDALDKLTDAMIDRYSNKGIDQVVPASTAQENSTVRFNNETKSFEPKVTQVKGAKSSRESLAIMIQAFETSGDTAWKTLTRAKQDAKIAEMIKIFEC